MKETAHITTTPKEFPRQPPVHSKFAFSHILAPTDFSQKSEIAVDYAVELARRLGAQLTLLHVFPEPFALDYIMGGIPAELWVPAKEEARKKLDEEAERAKLAYQGIDSVLRTGVDLRQEILDTARDISADLVVLSTHGYTGWKHLLFGSEAEQILELATCPIMVVKSD